MEERTLEARLLVVAADGNEPSLSAIRQALDYLGTPYTVHLSRQSPGGLTPAMLATGMSGHYQGIILTTSSVGYFDGNTWRTALSDAEWQALADYEAAFGVRQVTWYTYPTSTLGFGVPSERDTAASPLSLRLTAAGTQVFPYLGSGPLVVRMAYAYLAAPLPGADLQPLLQDEQGNALVAVSRLPDGRENLAVTFDGSMYLVHSTALAYGVVNWVTRGLFLGYRRIYVGAQVDDVFLDNDIWNQPETVTYRMNGTDLAGAADWQAGAQQRLGSPGLRLDLAFNGLGTVPGEFPNDTLTPKAVELRDRFKWINHTYSHPYLDALDSAAVAREVSQNLSVASGLGLTGFSPKNLVTPNITGLYSLAAMQAAYDQGVRYVVSDSSMPGQGMTIPNAALRNFVLPRILMIPRRPTNLFYNVSSPAEWTGEYNELYRTYWGRDLTYQEVLDKESDVLLHYLLRGELAPWMFHQSNLRFYEASHSLLTDLLDATFAKYRALYNLPLLSPSMDELGQRAAQRLEYSEAAVTSTIVPGQSITLCANKNVVVPVTGLWTACAEQYGGQPTTFISLQAGQVMQFPLLATQPQGVCPSP